MSDWMKGAGLLIASRDEAGNNFVLLGKKRPSRQSWKRNLSSLGYSLHGWTVPFGTLDEADGSFARCAIRETAEEVFGMAEGRPYKDYERKMIEEFGLPVKGLVESLQPTEGWTCRDAASVAFGFDHRVFFLRVPFVLRQFPGSHEFDAGLQWCSFQPPAKNSPLVVSVGGQQLDEPWHWALTPTLENFRSSIVG